MGFFQKVKSFVWSKHFLKQSAYIVGVYVLVIMIVVFYLDAYTAHGEKIEVPNIVGMNTARGVEKLDEVGLKIEILDSVYDPEKPTGTIVSQDPLPTKLSTVSVKSGRIIRVQVSKKTRLVEMPSLIDKSERFAESVLKNRGLKFKKTYVPTNEANGAVLKQLFNGNEIKEGTRVPIGSTITLVVGQNNAQLPVTLVDLSGLTISEANARLSGMSLQLFVGSCSGCISGADSLNAIITIQSPEYLDGTMVPAGTVITVSAQN